MQRWQDRGAHGALELREAGWALCRQKPAIRAIGTVPWAESIYSGTSFAPGALRRGIRKFSAERRERESKRTKTRRQVAERTTDGRK